MTSVFRHINSVDEEPGPAHLDYSGWEALSRIIPGFGRPPRTTPCFIGGLEL